jgi:hypothetical protein
MPVVATGGTITETTVNGALYRVHTFTTSGDFTVTTGGEVEYLIVGGGSGGAQNNYFGVAGSGGGVLEGTITPSGPVVYSIVVGSGGQALGSSGNPGSYAAGYNGQPSSAFGLTAGGGINSNLNNGVSGTPQSYLSYNAGGGAGGAATGPSGPGPGYASSITGVEVKYAGGGGGGDSGAAGVDGGGSAANAGARGGDGIPNRGGGGGSGSTRQQQGSGAGGSGVVILRYLVPVDSLTSDKIAVVKNETFTVTLVDTDAANGAQIPYVISGVTSQDINLAPLTGNFTIINDSIASIEFTSTSQNKIFTITANGLSVSVELAPYATGTGGTLTETPVDGELYSVYRVHTFTTSGNFTVTTGGAVEYLVVGGGGGGGETIGGGGGGGAVKTGVIQLSAASTLEISIGTGGLGGYTGITTTALYPGGYSGNPTVMSGPGFDTITMPGGGAGGGYNETGTSPTGTGGGPGGGQGAGGGAGVAPGSGLNNGGTSAGNTNSGAGGGGAGTAGTNSTSGSPGAGGGGIEWPLGSGVYYGGGGGGSAREPSGGTGAAGGTGGGGQGGTGAQTGTPGADNTGGGGGGGGYRNSDSFEAAGGDGGSGVVILRYIAPASLPLFISDKTSVSENETFTVTIFDPNAANGAQIPYVISGVTSQKINLAPLTGNFTINNYIASIEFTSTSRTYEIFTITANGLSVSVELARSPGVVYDSLETVVVVKQITINRAELAIEDYPIEFTGTETPVITNSTVPLTFVRAKTDATVFGDYGLFEYSVPSYVTSEINLQTHRTVNQTLSFSTNKTVYVSGSGNPASDLLGNSDTSEINFGIRTVLDFSIGGAENINSSYNDYIAAWTNDIRYVATNGSDTNDGLSQETAWQTYNYAHSQIENITTPVMLIIKPGVYTVNSIVIDSTYETLFRDKGYERTYLCSPGLVRFVWTAAGGTRDCPMAQFTNANTKLIGAIVERNNNGRSLNYAVAMFRGFGTTGSFLNCVFRETAANGNWSLHYDNNNSMPVTIDQCVFYTTENAASPYSGGGGMTITNCVFTHDDSSGVATTNTLFNTTVNGTTYETTSATNQGVYYGTYRWYDSSYIMYYPNIPYTDVIYNSYEPQILFTTAEKTIYTENNLAQHSLKTIVPKETSIGVYQDRDSIEQKMASKDIMTSLNDLTYNLIKIVPTNISISVRDDQELGFFVNADGTAGFAVLTPSNDPRGIKVQVPGISGPVQIWY